MITEEDIRKIADLACIHLEANERPLMTTKLNSILEYIEKLLAIDVANVDPMSHVHGSTNVFRPDIVVPDKNPQAMLNNAPSRSGNFLKVPIIIEQ